MQDIERTERFNDLLDLYGCLLTKKQEEITSMYFAYDLSLSEIAENTKTTRAAVYDLIKRVCKILEEYEEKLQLLRKKKEILQELDKLEDSKIKEKIENIID